MEELASVEMCLGIGFRIYTRIQMGQIYAAILLRRPLPVLPNVPILNLHVDESETRTNLIKDMSKYTRS